MTTRFISQDPIQTKSTRSKISIRNAHTQAAVPNHPIDPSQCSPSHQTIKPSDTNKNSRKTKTKPSHRNMFLNRNQKHPKQTWYVNTTVSESKTAWHHHNASLLIHIQLALQHTLLEAISLILGRWCSSRRRRHGLSPLLMHRLVLHAVILRPEPYFTDQQPSSLPSREACLHTSAHSGTPHTPRGLWCNLRDPHITQRLRTP